MSFRRLLRPSGRGKALRRINSCQPHLHRDGHSCPPIGSQHSVDELSAKLHASLAHCALSGGVP